MDQLILERAEKTFRHRIFTAVGTQRLRNKLIVNEVKVELISGGGIVEARTLKAITRRTHRRAVVVWRVLASGQIQMRRIDRWQDLKQATRLKAA